MNGREVEMVTGGEAGNSYTGTWRRVHCRNGREVKMVTGGEELHGRLRYGHRGGRRAEGGSPGDGCTVTFTGRGPERAGGGSREELKVFRGRELSLKYFHQTATRICS